MSRELAKNTLTVSSMTLVSRISGFVRDMVGATLFGATGGFDAFVLAFKIPNFMRRLFAEGAFSQAFVPVLAECKEKEGDEGVKAFANDMAGSLGSVLLIITVLGIMFAAFFVWVFAPGFDTADGRFPMAVDMLRVTFPYLFLISLTAFMSGILNMYGCFWGPAITPVLLNVSMIFSSLLLASFFTTPVMALAVGVLLGGVLQFLFQLPFLKARGIWVRPRLGFKDARVKKVLKLMIPALVGVSVNQINLIVDSAFASFLPAGSVSWLYYADRLMEFPLGVFGVALATVVLPKLSRQHASDNAHHYKETLAWGVRSVFLVGLPAAVGLGVLALPLTSTLFYHGAFSQKDAIATSECLLAYSVGILGFMAAKVLASGFYAKQDLKTPVRIAIFCMILNIVLNAAFIKHFHHMGLALATAIAALANTFLLAYTLQKRGLFRIQNELLFFTRVIIACLGMGVCVWYFANDPSLWLDGDKMTRVLYLTVAVLLGMGSFVAFLFLSGFRLSVMRERIA